MKAKVFFREDDDVFVREFENVTNIENREGCIEINYYRRSGILIKDSKLVDRNTLVKIEIINQY